MTTREAALELIYQIERHPNVQRRRGDVVEDCEGFSVLDNHPELYDYIEELREALEREGR